MHTYHYSLTLHLYCVIGCKTKHITVPVRFAILYCVLIIFDSSTTGEIEENFISGKKCFKRNLLEKILHNNITFVKRI